jgi:hypothetical protein
MTYVFYETGNNDFFARISQFFSTIFVWYVFVNLFTEGLDKNGDAVDKDLLKQKTDEHKKALTALNCFLFPAVDKHCKNRQCNDCHKIVLASDQVAVFEREMIEAIRTLIGGRTYIKDRTIRKNMQDVFQGFQHINKDDFEHIKINCKDYPGEHSIDYKQNHLGEYKDKYFRQANEIGQRDGYNHFVYIRADKPSDYSDFYEKVVLPDNGKPSSCELFYVI